MRKLLLISLLAIAFTSCTTKNNKSNKIIGAKIYEYKGDLNKLVNEWTDLGINTVFASKTMAANKEFRTLLKEQNIKVFVIFPVYFNEDLLDKDSSYYGVSNKGNRAELDWVKFVCPTNAIYRKQKINELAEYINTNKPDGISIDFIRHFLYWEMVRPDTPADSIVHGCFCNHCLQQFQTDSKEQIPNTLTTFNAKVKWLETNNAWHQWRTDLITTMVKDLTTKARELKPDIKINIHIVPWRSNDYNKGLINIAGQDIKALAQYTDYLSPMCYSWMLYRDAKWVHSVVQDMNVLAPGKIIPSIEVNECYREGKLTFKEFKENYNEAMQNPSAGVVFWAWDQLDADPQKKNFK